MIAYGQIILPGGSDSGGDDPGYHDLLCKTAIAWFSISSFLGLDGMYANPLIGWGCSSIARSWQVGTVKEPFFCGRVGFWAIFFQNWTFAGTCSMVPFYHLPILYLVYGLLAHRFHHRLQHGHILSLQSSCSFSTILLTLVRVECTMALSAHTYS